MQPQRGSGAYGGTSSTNADMSTTETPSTSRVDTSSSSSRLQGQRRRPFFARVADRNRTRVATPFDNSAETLSNSTSDESTSSSDEDVESNGVTSHLHTGKSTITFCRDHCPAPLSYFVWQKGYYNPFPLTVGILSPLIFILFTLFICFNWCTHPDLCYWSSW